MDDNDNMAMLETAAIPSSSTEQNKNGSLDLLLLDSALSEYLLDINTGITYRLVDLNGGSSFFTTSQESNAGYTPLLVDHDPSSTQFLTLPSAITSASASSQNPTPLSSQIHSIPSLSHHQMLRSVSGVVEDSELDEIISVVKEDMTHDEEMIETCGKLPPVHSEHILYRRLPAPDQSVLTKSSDPQRSHYNSDFRPEHVGLSRSADHKKVSLVSEEFTLVPSIKEGIANLGADDSQVLSVRAREEECRSMVLSNAASSGVASSDNNGTRPKIEDDEETPLILTPSAAPSHVLCRVDEDISLEDREAIMQAVQEKLGPRRKPDYSNRAVFEGDKDKLVVYICNLCGQVFEQLSHYHGHLRKHTEEFVWKCTQCSPENAKSTFRTQTLLKAHVRRTHSAPRPFSCELCADAFLYPSHLFSHLRAVHKCERDLACPLCPKRRHSGDSNPRPTHYPSLDLAPSDPLSRSVLDKSWSLAQLKAQVDNLTRENADLTRRLESGALVFDRYRADMRRQIDALRAQLDALKESHRLDVERPERDGSGADGASFHENGLCANRTAGDGGSETSGEDAQTHPVEDAQTHPVENAQTHPVVEVDMPADEGVEEDDGRVVRTPAFKKPRNHLTMFYKKSDLMSHLSVHLQLKQHLCELCGKGFSHSSNLSVHRRSHTGSRPYPCVHCGRRFRQINALNIHTANHLNPAPPSRTHARLPPTSQSNEDLKDTPAKMVPPATSPSTASDTTLSTRLSNSLSTRPANSLSTRPDNSLSTRPANSLSTRPDNSLSTRPANSLSTRPDNSLSTRPANSLSTRPANSLSTRPANSLSTRPANSLSIRPANSLYTRPATSLSISQSSKATTLPEDQSPSNHASASPNSELSIGSSEDLDESSGSEDKASLVSQSIVQTVHPDTSQSNRKYTKPITSSTPTPSITQSTNRSITQSTNPSVTHSTNQPTTQHITESTTSPITQSTTQNITQSIHPSITISTSSSIAQSTTQHITQSTNSPTTQSNNPSIAQSTNSSVAESTEHLISLRENGRAPKKFYCLVCGQTFRYRLLLRNHMSDLHETQKLFQCSECVQIYHHVYEFLSHSCISGDRDRAGSGPDLISDHSEELISLLSEILNSCHPGGGGANRNEELMGILMSLNVAEEGGGGGQGGGGGEGRERGGDKVLVKEEPVLDPATLDHEIDMSSGEISAEQVFRNISSSSLSSLKHPFPHSLVPSTHTLLPFTPSLLPLTTGSETTSTSSNQNTSLAPSSSSSLPLDVSCSAQVTSLASSVPSSAQVTSLACSVPSSAQVTSLASSVPSSAQVTSLSSSVPVSLPPAAHLVVNEVNSTSGSPSRLCVSLSTVERLKRMISLGGRNKETLARIVDRLKRHGGDKHHPSPCPSPSPPGSLPCPTTPPPPLTTTPTSAENKKKKKKHFCARCQAGFTRAASLRVHVSSVHNGSREDRFTHACKLCPAVFASEAGLRNHERQNHMSVQRFRCDDTSEGVCERDFATRHKLQLHKQRDHSKARPHECAACGKRFFSLYDLKMHGLVHTGEKPYACSLCSLAFRHSSHLLRHRRWVHLVDTA